MGLRLEYTEPYHINKIQAWLRYMYCIYMYPIHFEVFVDNSATLFFVDETKVLLNNDFIKGPKKKMFLQELMEVSDTCIHTILRLF